MSNALLQYDMVLKKDHFKMIMCDDFYQGVYFPQDDKIMLCANTLMNKPDFENAIHRQLIFMYDHKRGKGAHDLNKCKHLACSEVRAALFSNSCKTRASQVMNSSQKEKFDA